MGNYVKPKELYSQESKEQIKDSNESKLGDTHSDLVDNYINSKNHVSDDDKTKQLNIIRTERLILFHWKETIKGRTIKINSERKSKSETEYFTRINRVSDKLDSLDSSPLMSSSLIFKIIMILPYFVNRFFYLIWYMFISVFVFLITLPFNIAIKNNDSNNQEIHEMIDTYSRFLASFSVLSIDYILSVLTLLSSTMSINLIAICLFMAFLSSFSIKEIGDLFFDKPKEKNKKNDGKCNNSFSKGNVSDYLVLNEKGKIAYAKANGKNDWSENLPLPMFAVFLEKLNNDYTNYLSTKPDNEEKVGKQFKVENELSNLFYFVNELKLINLNKDYFDKNDKNNPFYQLDLAISSFLNKNTNQDDCLTKIEGKDFEVILYQKLVQNKLIDSLSYFNSLSNEELKTSIFKDTIEKFVNKITVSFKQTADERFKNHLDNIKNKNLGYRLLLENENDVESLNQIDSQKSNNRENDIDMVDDKSQLTNSKHDAVVNEGLQIRKDLCSEFDILESQMKFLDSLNALEVNKYSYLNHYGLSDFSLPEILCPSCKINHLILDAKLSKDGRVYTAFVCPKCNEIRLPAYTFGVDITPKILKQIFSDTGYDGVFTNDKGQKCNANVSLEIENNGLFFVFKDKNGNMLKDEYGNNSELALVVNGG